jgi:thiamine-phosphate pyrophosphorylase
MHRLDRQALRIIDANSNRTREALRVVEDVLRFWHEKGALSRRLKRERHKVARYCDELIGDCLKGLASRDTGADPGRSSMPRSEATRRNVAEIVVSNFRRAEEGLRVLEEIAKLADPELSRKFKRSRFTVYDLERDCMIFMGRGRARD